MRRFWRRRPLGLEAELRANRAEPRRELIESITESIGESRSIRPRRSFRVAAVVGVTTVLLVGAGTFGGIAYSTGGGPSASEKGDNGEKGERGDNGEEGKKGDNGEEGKKGDDDDRPSDHQYKHKVVICHNPSGKHPKTMRVKQNAVQRHLNHGDTLGRCPRRSDDDD